MKWPLVYTGDLESPQKSPLKSPQNRPCKWALKQLKRSCVPKAEIVSLYITCIRSVCDYSIPVLHSLLPEYLVKDLERVQKRALAIICPNQTYSDALLSINLDSLEQHHHHLSQSEEKGFCTVLDSFLFYLFFTSQCDVLDKRTQQYTLQRHFEVFSR